MKPKKKLSPEELAAIADQAKEDPPKLRPWKAEYRLSYTEKVTVRVWYGEKFLNPINNIPAHRIEKDGKLIFYTIARAINTTPTKGSEITDKDGIVFIVESVTQNEYSGYQASYVTPKSK